MQEYPWLEPQYQDLSKKYLKKILHPVILIKSIKNIGLFNLIFKISKFFLCSNKELIKSCNKCKSCILMEKKTHPDFYTYKQFNLSWYSIGITEIRRIISSIHFTAQYGLEKIVWLPNIEYITNEGINILLKTIEEPPKNTRFFLHTSNINILNKMLCSRTNIYLLNHPTNQEIINFIHRKNLKIKKKDIILALNLYNYLPESATFFLKEKLFYLRNKLINVIKNYFYKYNNIELFNFIYNKKILHIILWICYILIDAIKISILPKKLLINLDYIDFIQEVSEKFNTSILIKSLETWIKCRYILKTSINIDKKLIIIEQILFWNQLLKNI